MKIVDEYEALFIAELGKDPIYSLLSEEQRQDLAEHVFEVIQHTTSWLMRTCEEYQERSHRAENELLALKYKKKSWLKR